jgi:predicted RecA/RadA family phage recombinase
MAYNAYQAGDVVTITAGGTVTVGTIYAGDSRAGVYLNSGVNGDTVPVAVEGVFTMTTATTAGATKKFALFDKVYSTSAGVLTTIATTAGNVPLGIALNTTTSAAGAQSCRVKLCSF